MKKLLLKTHSNPETNGVWIVLEQIDNNMFQVVMNRLKLTGIASQDVDCVLITSDSFDKAYRVYKENTKTKHFARHFLLGQMPSKRYKQVYRNNHEINKLKKEN